MELKPLIVVDDEVWGLFESHLYGIETHLDGEANGGELGVWIAPLWNWNKPHSH